MPVDRFVDVGQEYCQRLTDRTYEQNGNPYNARDFRGRYLSPLDCTEAWEEKSYTIELDFSGVKKIAPGFANEAFAYFAQYAGGPEDIRERISICNASRVKMEIIEEELRSAFGNRHG